MTIEELIDVIDKKIEDADQRSIKLLPVSQELSFMAQGESMAYWAVKQIIEVNMIETK